MTFVVKCGDVGFDVRAVHADVDEDVGRGRRSREDRRGRCAAMPTNRVLLMDRSRLETDERAEARVRFAEDVAAERELRTDEQLLPRPAVTRVDLSRRLVVVAAVILVVELPIRGLRSSPNVGSHVDAREHAACADAVAEHAPIGAPVAEHAPFVAQAVAVDVMDVPAVLPLA